MVDKEKKEALALVFGVVRRDSMLSGVPGFVPGLREKLTCTGCELKLVKGLPVEFEKFMSEEQKKQYRELVGYKARNRKKTEKVVETTEE